MTEKINTEKPEYPWFVIAIGIIATPFFWIYDRTVEVGKAVVRLIGKNRH